MLVPGLAIVSAAILVLLVVQQDLAKASLAAALAGVILAVIAAATGSSVVAIILGLVTTWLPVVALAATLRATRSLTLTLQLSVLLVMLGAVAFFLFTPEPASFWQRMIEESPVLANLQLGAWQEAAGVSAAQFAGVMTTVFVLGAWFGLVIAILLGYWLYQQVPGNTPEFGRFSDLNFGRVLALLLAITSVIGFAFNVTWVQSIAFILFAVFWLQGAAFVHWLHASGHIPLFAVIGMYVATLVLLQYVFSAVAVVGYTDAWFRYRNRVKKKQ